MIEEEMVRRYGNYGTDTGPDYDGVTARFTSADEKPCPPDVKMIINACRSLGADALVLEMADHAVVVAINNYDGTYAAASCGPGTHLSSVARSLQIRLYSGPCDERSNAFLPAAMVHAARARWERQIALVFGCDYAAKLMIGASREKTSGEMSPDDLERIRLWLSSAIGGCLHLEKVDK